MNFDCVQVDKKGRMYMAHHRPWTPLEKIQLLQRWILVTSFAYYQLDENIVPDYRYDANAHQLVDLMNQYPGDAKLSRYRDYFYDYTGETGYHLIGRVEEKDSEMYRRIWIDALWALDLKHKRGWPS